MRIPKTRKHELKLINEIERAFDKDPIENPQELLENIKVLSEANPGQAYRYGLLLIGEEKNKLYPILEDLELKVEELNNSDRYIPFNSLSELINVYKELNSKQTTKSIHEVLNRGMASLYTMSKESYTLSRIEKVMKVLLRNVYMGDCDASVLHSSATQICMWEAAYIGLRDGSMENIYPYDILENEFANFQMMYLELIRAFQMFDVVMEGVLTDQYLDDDGNFIKQPYEIDVPQLVKYSEEVCNYLQKKRDRIKELLNKWEVNIEVVSNDEYEEALFVAREISLEKLESHISSIQDALKRYKNRNRILIIK